MHLKKIFFYFSYHPKNTVNNNLCHIMTLDFFCTYNIYIEFEHFSLCIYEIAYPSKLIFISGGMLQSYSSRFLNVFVSFFYSSLFSSYPSSFTSFSSFLNNFWISVIIKNAISNDKGFLEFQPKYENSFKSWL